MTIKKQFEELMIILNENENRKVKTILPQILELVSTKKANSTHLYNDEGRLIGIFCYYHKKWEAIDEHDYGLKKHSKSGYNSMCKVGVNNWTKQTKIAKLAKEALLGKVASGELEVCDIKLAESMIDEERAIIIESDLESWDNTDEIIARLG